MIVCGEEIMVFMANELGWFHMSFRRGLTYNQANASKRRGVHPLPRSIFRPAGSSRLNAPPEMSGMRRPSGVWYNLLNRSRLAACTCR